MYGQIPDEANPAIFSNPVPVLAKYWPDFILIFKLLKCSNSRFLVMGNLLC